MYQTIPMTFIRTVGILGHTLGEGISATEQFAGVKAPGNVYGYFRSALLLGTL
jgi:hypothetical protein